MQTKRNIVRHEYHVDRTMREGIHGHKSSLIWFTGLSGAGKSTVANAVEKALHDTGYSTYVLDGDNIRSGLCKDLGFSDEDRSENIRRISEVGKLCVDAGVITLTAFISPFIKDREIAKDVVGEENFIEIYCSTPLHVCESRDPKGLYKKARSGEIPEFTGLTSPYEAPLNPALEINTGELSVEQSTLKVIQLLQEKGLIV